MVAGRVDDLGRRQLEVGEDQVADVLDRLARVLLGVGRDEDQRDDVEDEDRDERERSGLARAAARGQSRRAGHRGRGRGLGGDRGGGPIVTRQAGST